MGSTWMPTGAGAVSGPKEMRGHVGVLVGPKEMRGHVGVLVVSPPFLCQVTVDP